MNQKSNPEEVDILQFFAAFGQMFSNLFRGIKNLFVRLFYFFVESLLYLKKNILYVSIGAILGLALSFIGKKSGDSYYAQAMLRTNYGSQLSLNEKVDAINDLIEKEKFNQLAKFLQIDSTNASHFTGVKIEPVFDDALMLDDYENYLKTKDTVVYKFLEFEDFKKSFRRNSQLNKYWDIRFTADEPSVFNNFNKTFKGLFKNETDLNQRKENFLNALKISRDKTLRSIEEIDSLRTLYNMVLLENAKNQKGSSTNIVLNTNRLLGPEQPYNLFEERKQLFLDLLDINKKINKYNEAIVLLNDFPNYGIRQQHIIKNNHVKYALYGFLLALLILRLKDFNNFLSRYEKQKNQTK